MICVAFLTTLYLNAVLLKLHQIVQFGAITDCPAHVFNEGHEGHNQFYLLIECTQHSKHENVVIFIMCNEISRSFNNNQYTSLPHYSGKGRADTLQTFSMYIMYNLA